MKQSDVKLRFADEDDCRFIWDVNNQPHVRERSTQSDPIPWENHKKWFLEQVHRHDRQFLIAHRGGVDFGVVRFDLTPKRDEAVISIALMQNASGRGFGTILIRESISNVLANQMELQRVVALIRPDNPASFRAFEKAGFVKAGETTRNGIQLLVFEFRRSPQSGQDV